MVYADGKGIRILFIFIRHISLYRGSARNNAKKRDEEGSVKKKKGKHPQKIGKKERTKKKRIGADTKPSTPTQASDARMGKRK